MTATRTATYRDQVRAQKRIAAVVGAVLALPACSGSSDDQGLGVTSAAAPVSRSSTSSAPGAPTSAAPTLPDGADRATPEGATSFVKYFFAVYNHAFWTADPSMLEEISDSGCRFCSSAISAVRDVRSHHARIEGGRITVLGAVAAPTTGSVRTVVAVHLRQEGQIRFSPSGSVELSSSPSPSYQLDVAVTHVSGRWIVLAAASPPRSSP